MRFYVLDDSKLLPLADSRTLEPIEIETEFTRTDEQFVFNNDSPYGYSGPVIRLNGPAEYYIASLVRNAVEKESEIVCVDAGGRNFGYGGAVYAKIEDVKAAVEAWRPGLWIQMEHTYAKYAMNPGDLKPLIWKRMGFQEHEDIPKELKVVMCGQTEFLNGTPIEHFLKDLHGLVGNGIDVRIIHGAAPGADTIAAEAAKRIFGEDHVLSFPANWSLLGLKAGPLRNSVMIAQGPHLVVAFYNKEGALVSRGTNDTVNKATKKNIPVLKYEERVGWY